MTEGQDKAPLLDKSIFLNQLFPKKSNESKA